LLLIDQEHLVGRGRLQLGLLNELGGLLDQLVGCRLLGLLILGCEVLAGLFNRQVYGRGLLLLKLLSGVNHLRIPILLQLLESLMQLAREVLLHEHLLEVVVSSHNTTLDNLCGLLNRGDHSSLRNELGHANESASPVAVHNLLHLLSAHCHSLRLKAVSGGGLLLPDLCRLRL
jgi:hypothetical protein